jgi:uncharacterized protein
MNSYGYELLFGRGIEQNEEEGVRWLKQAAEFGQPNAMHTVASLYHEGRLVPKDAVEAAKWILLALDNYPPNDEKRAPAAQLEGVLLGVLSDAELTAARRRAESWQKRVAEPAERHPPPAFWSGGAVNTRRSGAS